MIRNIFWVVLLIAQTAHAKIWIVDSNSGATVKDFSNLPSAHSGASAGDTLYVIGSPNDYIAGKLTITKRLVIIGPGYFLNENPDTQVNLMTSYVFNPGTCTEVLEFGTGSSGSVIMGLQINGRVFINTNGITLRRNIFLDGQPGCSSPRIIINGSNIFILQNYIAGNSDGYGVEVNPGFTNITINNNYIKHACSGCGATQNAVKAPGSSVTIDHNVIEGGLLLTNSVVQNNIITTSNTLSFTSCTVQNNISAGSTLPGGNANQNSIAPATIFMLTGSSDGKFQLKGGSPAIGAGTSSSDCGIFSGSDPYKLSGIPPVPVIYLLTVPSVGQKNTGLPVTIKAKSNN